MFRHSMHHPELPGVASLHQTQTNPRIHGSDINVKDEHNRHNRAIVFVPRWHEWRRLHKCTMYCVDCDNRGEAIPSDGTTSSHNIKEDGNAIRTNGERPRWMTFISLNRRRERFQSEPYNILLLYYYYYYNIWYYY
jgi:hypothetical protein